jgi:hypothetical protein
MVVAPSHYSPITIHRTPGWTPEGNRVISRLVGFNHLHAYENLPEHFRGLL